MDVKTRCSASSYALVCLFYDSMLCFVLCTGSDGCLFLVDFVCFCTRRANAHLPFTCLCGVRMEEHATLSAEGANLLERLHHANLVVHGHHADQRSARCDSGTQRIQVDQAVGRHVEVCHIEHLLARLIHLRRCWSVLCCELSVC